MYARRRGSWAISKGSAGDAVGLHVLFASGKRPDRAAIRDFVRSNRSVAISHDPVEPSAVNQADGGGFDWIELLRDGLTFDLAGLSPGPAIAPPEMEHRFGLDEAARADALEGMALVPGVHLAAGANTLPVMRVQCALICDIVRHFDAVEAVAWPPARSGIGARYFESVTAAWLDGGPFPALGLTAFCENPDGSLQSAGLSYWIGQELQIAPVLSADKVVAARLGVRLVNHLVAIGGIDRNERVVGPDGNRLIMRPAQNERLIRVTPE